MEKFTKIVSTAVPVPGENIDTDQIIPARFLKATTRDGFGENLFRDWRFNRDGSPVEGFPLNDSRYAGSILVGGKNFGCGSSREHAAWALGDYGFRAIVSSFFADIFRNNALNNGILPVQVSQEFLNAIFMEIHNNSSVEILIDLVDQLISIPENDMAEEFEINPYKKKCLLNGYTDFEFLMNQKDRIAEYEKTSIYSFV